MEKMVIGIGIMMGEMFFTITGNVGLPVGGAKKSNVMLPGWGNISTLVMFSKSRAIPPQRSISKVHSIYRDKPLVLEKKQWILSD